MSDNGWLCQGLKAGIEDNLKFEGKIRIEDKL